MLAVMDFVSTLRSDQDEADHSQLDHGFAMGGLHFMVEAQTAGLHQPAESPLDEVRMLPKRLINYLPYFLNTMLIWLYSLAAAWAIRVYII